MDSSSSGKEGTAQLSLRLTWKENEPSSAVLASKVLEAQMNERKFKAVHRKVGGKTMTVLKDGPNGTGVILPFSCGFCRVGDRVVDGKLVPGTVQAAFRTRKERTEHTTRCPK
jgi:hypothetical protein